VVLIIGFTSVAKRTVAAALMVTDLVTEHPFESFTVMVYLPPARGVKVVLVWNVVPLLLYV
jgi:hypothetical protein